VDFKQWASMKFMENSVILKATRASWHELTNCRVWKDPTGAHDGCHCTASKSLFWFIPSYLIYLLMFLQEMGGAEGKVAYIGECNWVCCLIWLFSSSKDTEGTFRPERIMEIAERFGGKYSKFLCFHSTNHPSRPWPSLWEHCVCSCSE